MTMPRILVVRNDKLGDFMLAWPALALLKQSLPKARLTVLVPRYTQELAAICPWVDGVLTDPDELSQVNRECFDAVLTLFSTRRIGWQVFKGCIPVRMAPATKLAQFFYNHRVVQRRSRSEKPEYVYNLELARAFLHKLGVPAVEPSAPYWPMSSEQALQERLRLAQRLGADTSRPWFFLHAGSGGSASNVSIDQYAELVRQIHPRFAGPVQWVFTCGPGEEAKAEALNRLCSDVHGVVYRSTDGLAAFACSLSAAQLLIAGSTGPLHLAGALDVPTVGFFPAKRSSTALRWRPCNAPGRTLAFSPDIQHHDPDDMSSIDMVACANEVVAWYQGLAS
jgi:ADP-heptose:LPS heptosyltransferase